MTQEAPPAQPPSEVLIGAVVTTLVAFGALSTDLYLPSLPAIRASFAATPGEVQLTLSAFLFGFGANQLLHGPLSDRYGRRPVLLAGLAIYALASLVCAAADSLALLIAARVVQAFGACAAVVIGRAVVRDLYEQEEAARVLSYVAAAMALAPAIGPILGGLVEAAFGWRANFLLLAGIGLAALTLVLTLLPETNRFRGPGTPLVRRLLHGYRGLLAVPRYRAALLIATAGYAGIFVFISGSSFLFMESLGLGPRAYGFCFAVIVVGYMLGAFGSGRLNRRHGSAQLLAWGTALAAFGGLAGLLMTLLFGPGLVQILGGQFLYMLGVGFVMANATALALAPFPERAGAAAALLGCLQMLAAAAVGAVLGQLLDPGGVAMMTALALAGIGGFAAERWLLRPTRATSTAARPDSPA